MSMNRRWSNSPKSCIGMMCGSPQPGHDARLPAEPLLELRLAAEQRGEQLEGDDPVVLGVVGLEHLTHSATADHAE
jgi:hypothetical protein